MRGISLKPRVDFERALIIHGEYVDMILNGKKNGKCEASAQISGGKIGLIRSGSGEICGTVELVDCKGPLTLKAYKANARKAGMKASDISRSYLPAYAWVLKNPKKFRKPIKYKHPSGAISWVNVKRQSNRNYQRKPNLPGKVFSAISWFPVGCASEFYHRMIRLLRGSTLS